MTSRLLPGLVVSALLMAGACSRSTESPRPTTAVDDAATRAGTEPRLEPEAQPEPEPEPERDVEPEPDGETEVFLADGGGEYGLWYRLAPVTFLGGTLLGEGCSRDPLEAAALGSALITGPKAGAHGAAHQRLARARAVRSILTPADLADAAGDLLAPDRAARLAQAAWAASSDGAEATDQVLAAIRAVMDGGS